MIRQLAAYFRNKSRGPRREEVIVPAISFVGEQDGPIERELKDEWKKILAQHDAVKSAYLARATYASEPQQHVVLCLHSTSGADLELVARLQQPFVSRFNSAEKLDVAFISPEQQLQVRTVCEPFHIAV
jgi:SseB protein C-terminal domain